MKAGKEHKVPLSQPAIQLLNELNLDDVKVSKYVFPGTDPTSHLDESTMRYLKRRMKVKETIHGFRSSFRSWADDCTDADHDLKEMSLAHAVSNSVEAAYRRTTMFEKRRELMAAWALYIAP